MNYTFKLAHDIRGGKSQTTLTQVTIDEFARPVIGTQIVLPISRKTWRIVRVEPPSNPPGQHNTYFVEEYIPFIANSQRP